MSQGKASVPQAFLETHKRLEEWRNTNQPRRRLPESIWRQAVELAQQHGVNCAARVLRLDYAQLKKRLQPALPQQAPNFVEIIAGNTVSSTRCLIEVESAHGKLRVEMMSPPDWTELLRAFRRA
jgi:hypothetical protein